MKKIDSFRSWVLEARGMHYICFGYGDVPSGKVSIIRMLVLRTVSISQFWYKERYQFSRFWYEMCGRIYFLKKLV